MAKAKKKSPTKNQTDNFNEELPKPHGSENTIAGARNNKADDKAARPVNPDDIQEDERELGGEG